MQSNYEVLGRFCELWKDGAQCTVLERPPDSAVAHGDISVSCQLQTPRSLLIHLHLLMASVAEATAAQCLPDQGVSASAL